MPKRETAAIKHAKMFNLGGDFKLHINTDEIKEAQLYVYKEELYLWRHADDIQLKTRTSASSSHASQWCVLFSNE